MRGTVVYGPSKVWEWHDSRSMQKADGRFVCAKCAIPSALGNRNWVWGICPPLTNSYDDERNFKLEPTP